MLLKMGDVKEQIHTLQTEIEESRSLLHKEDYEGMSRQELQAIIECKERQQAELQH